MNTICWTGPAGLTSFEQTVDDWKEALQTAIGARQPMWIAAIDNKQWSLFAAEHQEEVNTLASAITERRSLLAQQLLGAQSVYRGQLQKNQTICSLFSAIGLPGWTMTVRAEKHSALGRAYYERAMRLAEERQASGPPVLNASEWIRPKDIEKPTVVQLLKNRSPSLFCAFHKDTVRGIWNDITADRLPFKTFLFAAVYGPQIARCGLGAPDIRFQLDWAYSSVGQADLGNTVRMLINKEFPQLIDRSELGQSAREFRSSHAQLLPALWCGKQMTGSMERATPADLVFKHALAPNRKGSKDPQVARKAQGLGSTLKRALRARIARSTQRGQDQSLLL